MIDLSLLSRLQMPDTVSLILKKNPGDRLDYYIIAQTVTYSAICNGKCNGFIEKDMTCFNIRLSSLVPLIAKGYKLDIHYVEDKLYFVTEDGKTQITPLYVEYNDPNAVVIIEKYLKFSEALQQKEELSDLQHDLQKELDSTKREYEAISRMNLSGGPPENPFGEFTGNKKIDAEYLPRIQNLQSRVNKVSTQSNSAVEINLSKFSNLVGIASRLHEVVNFCSDYATVSFSGAYLIQKCTCPVMALQGQILNTLVKDGNGENFYMFNESLVYIHGTKSQTVVFLSKYLPSGDISTDIITRGVVYEKYSINISDAVTLFNLVRSRFSSFKMNLGSGTFELANDNGELISMKFSVEDAKTLQLARLVRGEPVDSGVLMSTIDIPKPVQSALGLFKNRLSVFVKKNKVIFQNEDLYLVFSR